MFTGYTPDTLDFFRDIRFHNEKAWFEENRERYERSVRTPSIALAAELAQTVLLIDPLADTRPARVISRPRRDTRFTHDKSPYRNHVWIGFRHDGESASEGVSFFFEIFEDKYHYGFGQYYASRQRMDALRAMLLADTAAAERMLAPDADIWKHLSLTGETYKKLLPSERAKTRVPDTLRAIYDLHSVCFIRQRPIGAEVFSSALVRQVQEAYLSGAQLYRFLRRADELNL